MRKYGSLQYKTLLQQRIILIIFGILFFFVLLEICLRIGGFVLLSLQEQRNKISINRKGAYRIMCLGESTTAEGGGYSYPNQLEAILNARNIGKKFSVINKGISGTTTYRILSILERNLDKYNPDMVITMMGKNDGGTHMPYEDITASKANLFLRSFRIYKLARLIWLHMVTNAKELGLYNLKTDRRIGKKGGDSLGNQFV